MTALLENPPPLLAGPRDAAQSRAWSRSTLAWLAAILAAQVGLALRPGLNANAFQDEGLYVYFGHLEIARLLHGTAVPGSPGGYFSGAPWLYPVLAAVGDSLGGLQGARAVSLGFALAATVAVLGIGRELFGTRAGVIGAAVFALNGSVIFLSHFATYDSMAMSLVALATWLTLHSVRHRAPIQLPAVAVLLTAAFFAKYAAAVYVPIVGLIAVAAGWRTYRRKIFWLAGVVMGATGLLIAWILDAWGRDLVPGVLSTTASRTVLIPAGRLFLTHEVLVWVGPWLVLAVLAGAVCPADRRVAAVLLLGSVIGPAEQIRIGESVSLSKHVAYGVVFAGPLAGALLARLLDRSYRRGIVILAGSLAALGALGLHYSGQFLTNWDDDSALLPVLTSDIAASGHQPILGEISEAQRYELQHLTTPQMWHDTYFFSYSGLVGPPAYARAIDQGFFAIIYLNLGTSNGRFIHDYLATHQTFYRAPVSVTRYQHGGPVGSWLVYTARPVDVPGA